jgi:hypothetical protein
MGCVRRVERGITRPLEKPKEDRRKTGMKKYSFSRLARCVICGATLFVLLPASLSHAQQRWTRTYGGASFDKGRMAQQTSDGGYIVAGWTYSIPNSEQIYLVKTNSSGDTLWTRTFGTSYPDWAYSIQQTSDGGYIIGGTTYPSGAELHAFLVKTDASGDTLWSREYGYVWDDYGYCVRQTADGGYIVSGTTYSYGDTLHSGDVWLFKTNSSGNTLWSRYYGGTANDFGYGVQQTTDGGYIVTGATRSFGFDYSQVYLVKTNASGDTLWTRTYGGMGSDWGYSVQQTSDGGYIVAGTYDPGTNNQVYLIKTNASGDTLWTRTYGGTGWEESRSVQQTTDGGYIIAGTTGSYGDNRGDVRLIKTNASGDTLWTRTYGGMGSDWGYSAQQTSDGGYIVSGYTYSFRDTISGDVYLIKTDANGNVGVETSVRQLNGSTAGRLTATPNPFSSFARVPGHENGSFALYDVSGRRVGTYKGNRIGEGLAPGVYFMKGLGNASAAPVRIVKVR